MQEASAALLALACMGGLTRPRWLRHVLEMDSVLVAPSVPRVSRRRFGHADVERHDPSLGILVPENFRVPVLSGKSKHGIARKLIELDPVVRVSQALRADATEVCIT